MLHEGVHDPRRHDSPLHRPGDATGPTDGVDGAHVERVPALDPLAAARHAQRGAEDRGLEVVHCDGVAAEQRAHVAVADEPDQVFARPGVHQRGPHDPQSLAAALLLLAQQLRQQAVVRRPLAGHFRLHEAELVGAVTAAEEALDVYVDALAAVLRRADGDRRALLHPTRLGHHEVAVRVEDDHAVHPGEPRWAPCTAHLDVGRKVRGRKKTVGKNPVGGCGLEASVGSPRERRRFEVGWSILEAGAAHRTVNIRGTNPLTQRLRSQQRDRIAIDDDRAARPRAPRPDRASDPPAPARVWANTWPPFGPRPARPATWATSWKVRSAARKSGRWSPVSASTTPTTVTFGKSSPFAIIWVPSRMSTSPRATRSRMRWCAHLVLVVSRSIRATRAAGNRRPTNCSSCWLPSPR